MSGHRPAVVLALIAVLLAGCQLRLATDIAVGSDGGGAFAVVVVLDGELSELLEDAGVDVTDGLDVVRARAPRWDLVVDGREDGGREIRASTTFEDPEGFREVVTSLHAALDGEDLALFEDLRLRPLDDGALALEGRAGLRLPAAPGARGTGVGFDADDLERLLEEQGDELVRYDLRVTLPTAPREHDADVADGRALVWHLPVGELRDVRAVAPAASRWPWLLAIGLAAAGVGVAVGVTIRVRRARG